MRDSPNQFCSADCRRFFAASRALCRPVHLTRTSLRKFEKLERKLVVHSILVPADTSFLSPMTDTDLKLLPPDLLLLLATFAGIVVQDEIPQERKTLLAYVNSGAYLEGTLSLDLFLFI